MNINQYNNSIDEIRIKKIEVDDLLTINSKRITRKRNEKWISVIAIIFLLIFIIIPDPEIPGLTYSMNIKVYAAEKEIQLTEDYINFDLKAEPINGGNSSSRYFINYNLNLKCVGTNINTITYTCSDKSINKSNRLGATPYYVENVCVPSDEYSKYINQDNVIFGYKADGEDEAKITKLIGNSYTVNYDDQNNRQYGLVLSGDINNGVYEFNETIIKMDIILNDGSIQHKKIVINPIDKNSFGKIKMRIY